MLTEADLRILESLDRPQAITTLSNDTGYSPGYVSERVSRLETYELVTTTRQNRAKRVRAVQTPILDSYRRLTTTNPHIDFPSLVSPSMLRVCWFLDMPTAVTEMEPRLDLQRRRIYQLLDQLQTRGLLSKDDSQYMLTENLQPFAHFAQTVIKHEHRHRARTHWPAATVVWSGPHEALVAARNETPEPITEAFADDPDWQLTGLPRFAEYGLTFFPAGPPPYFYSELRNSLSPADLVAHTLLLDADTRNLSYCGLLLVATDSAPEEVRDAAQYYGIEETVNALLRFVETNGETRPEGRRLPEWPEMESLAAQYEVSL